MKTLISVIALLIGASGAFGQGVVAFRNDNLPGYARIYGPDMTTPFTGTTFAAQLWYGTSPASLQPHPTLAYFREPTTLSPGTWVGGNRTLTGIAAPPQPGPSTGPTIWLQVALWDSGPDRTITFDQARGQSGTWGVSSVFSYTQQNSSPPNPTEDTKMLNFVGFTIPEPSVIGLGLIGIGALFMLRRRKA